MAVKNHLRVKSPAIHRLCTTLDQIFTDKFSHISPKVKQQMAVQPIHEAITMNNNYEYLYLQRGQMIGCRPNISTLRYIYKGKRTKLQNM